MHAWINHKLNRAAQGCHEVGQAVPDRLSQFRFDLGEDNHANPAPGRDRFAPGVHVQGVLVVDRLGIEVIQGSGRFTVRDAAGLGSG
jgi:hypothetical protein